MRFAGIHWPENSGGEHPDRQHIAAMPGMAGAALICSPSARYHYDYLRTRNPGAVVVWRAIPRQGRLPADLDWIGKRVADECLNLWDEQPHGGAEWFLPLNELQFEKEAGEPFRSYAETASKLSNVRIALRRAFEKRGETVRLLFPAWVPQDDLERVAEWQDEARQWDAVCLHAYGSAAEMRARYDAYRAAFPSMPVFVGEWNANHTGADERAALEMWAAVAVADPLFMGATYYIWETNNPGERDLSIWGDGPRYALFLDPPEAPVTDLRAYAREAAGRAGIDPDRFVRQIDLESGFNPDAYNADSGATGIAQIIPRWHPAVDPNDPLASLDYAAGLMATYRRMFGSEAKALAAFNWGSGNVGGYTTAGGVVVPPWDGRRETLPGETRRYLDIVLGPNWNPPTVAYDPALPAFAQDDEWSCAPTSLRWALHAVGRRPTEEWIERTMLAEGVVSEQLGLLDATGAGLAAFVTRQYSEFGYSASSQDNVSFQAVAEEVGPYPLLLGGRKWNHWAAVRAYDHLSDTLTLMNPADGWGNVGQTLSREAFARLGPWSMVRVLHPDLIPAPEPAPPPEPPAPDPAAVIAHLEGVIREYETQLADRDARLAEAVSLLGSARVDYADRLQGVLDDLRRLAPRA